MIKAILFDLDGTLLNREASLKKFIENQYERLGHFFNHVDKETYCQRFITLDDNGYVWKDKVYADLVKELEITNIAATELLNDYTAHFQAHCVPFPHVKETLQKLQQQGLKLGMITNGLGQFQMNNIQALGIEDFFETILISEWEGMQKPMPEIFEKALQNLSVQAEESMFVGDHGVNDILAAKHVGMKTVWKENDFTTDLGAHYTIQDLLELVNIVEN